MLNVYRDRKAPGVDKEIYCLQKSFSIGTLRRWRAAYRKKGLAGLLMDYKTNSGKSRAITPEMQIFLIGQIGQKPHIKPATLYKLICKTFDPHPSRKTVYRFVNKWKKENAQEYTLLENPNRWKNNFMPAFGDAAAGVDHVGHTLEADSTKTDFFIEGVRFCFVAIMDVFSRQVVIAIAPTSKSTAIALCIRKAIIKWGDGAKNAARWHTFATMMLSAGEDVGWVQNMIGHSSLQMIFQRYYAWIPQTTRSDGAAFKKYVEKVENRCNDKRSVGGSLR